MQLQIIKPLPGIEYAYSNNTKLSKEVLSNRILIDGKFHVLNVFDDTNIKIALRHKTDKDFRFEQVDPLILGAIGSFHENGIYHFTTDMIARMIYQDTHHRVTEQVKQNIQGRIDAMMDLQIRFNIEEECLARQSNPKDDRLSNKRYTSFLPMKPIKAVFSANGKQGTGYHLYKADPLWEYAKYTKQIISYRFDAFSQLKGNKSWESLIILKYIYAQMELMKNPNNTRYSRKICLYRVENHVAKGLFPACNIDPTKFKNWNEKHRKIRRLIEAFLDHCKTTQDKHLRIKGYKYYHTNSGEGYEIELYSKAYYNYKK